MKKLAINTLTALAICSSVGHALAADNSTKLSADDWYQTVLIEPFKRELEQDLDTAFAAEDATNTTADEWYQSVLFEPFDRSLDGELKEPDTTGGKSADRGNTDN